MKGIGKLILKVLLIYTLFAFLSCIIMPIISNHNPSDKRQRPKFTSKGQTEQAICIEDNTDALRARLRVIEEAEDEILLSTFQLQDDQSSRDMYAALKHAADRGVKVKLLLDGGPGCFFFRISKYFRALGSHENVEIRLYNPVKLLKPWTLNYRMHSKCLVADDSVYISGGRNTIDLFLGNYKNMHNIDRDILVYSAIKDEGNSVHQVINYFDDMWNLDVNKNLSYKKTDKTEIAEKELDERYDSLKIKYPEGFRDVDWANETIPVNHIYYLSNPADDTVKAPKLWDSICNILNKGKEIIIQTPYIICSPEMYEDVSELTSGDRDVRIITNAIETGANPWGCTDYLNHKQDILDTGVEVFEYMGKHSAHTKTILVDDNISLVGSFNMDMRSSYLNTESMLVIDSPEINDYLQKQMTKDMNQSRHILSDGTEIDGRNYTNSPMGKVKQIFYTFMRVLVVPFRHLL